MMHVSVMMLSYAALMVGALLAIAFLVVTRGQNIELRGSSVGTGGYRIKDTQTPPPLYQLQRNEDHPNSQPQLPLISTTTLTPWQESHSTSKTAVLDVATTPTSSVAKVATTTTLSPQRLNLADTLDNISYRIIGLGFPLLTIGIIAGAVWANEAWGSYWSWDPKETWALITWLIFAAYLHARITRGWQGRRPAILAATGFVVVWICYLGVNLLGKGLHSYGWFF
jgi:cytochrome c-type biogenesis protein CcsB